MVVPNRELVNKSSLNSSTYAISSTNFNLPTVDPGITTEIDIFKGKNPNNYDNVRGRKPSRSPASSRNISMVSSTSSIPYHEKMERNNNMDINDNGNTFPKLSYETIQEKKI